MQEYARGVASGQNPYFEISNGIFVAPEAARPRLAERIRQIGITRFLFGTDSPVLQGKKLKDIWPIVRARLPLTDAEFATIATQALPFVEPKPTR